MVVMYAPASGSPLPHCGGLFAVSIRDGGFFPVNRPKLFSSAHSCIYCLVFELNDLDALQGLDDAELLEMQNYLGYDVVQSLQSYRPLDTYNTQRFLGRSNRILGGMMVTLRRGTLDPDCSVRFRHLQVGPLDLWTSLLFCMFGLLVVKCDVSRIGL